MFRFSLRELFLTTTLAAACMAWWLDHERLTNPPEPPLMVRCGEDECLCVTDEEGKKLYIQSATLDLDCCGTVRHSHEGRYYNLFPPVYLSMGTTFSLSLDGNFYEEFRNHPCSPRSQITPYELPGGTARSIWAKDPGSPVDDGGKEMRISQRPPSLRIGPPYPKESE